MLIFHRKTGILFLFPVIMLCLSLVVLVYSQDETGASAQDDTVPLVAQVQYYKSMDWNIHQYDDLPIFQKPLSHSEHDFHTFFWKTYSDLEGVIFRAEFYDQQSQPIYTLNFFYHEFGVTIKTYQYNQPYAVHFYDKQHQLLIRESYQDGRLYSVTRYKSPDEYETELHGDKQENPYYWWGP